MTKMIGIYDPEGNLILVDHTPIKAISRKLGFSVKLDGEACILEHWMQYYEPEWSVKTVDVIPRRKK